MKLLDPLEGLIATITCIAFQMVFMASSFMVKLRSWAGHDEGDIIKNIEWQAKNNVTHN